MEKNFRDTLNERLKNPEFQKIYESIKKVTLKNFLKILTVNTLLSMSILESL